MRCLAFLKAKFCFTMFNSHISRKMNALVDALWKNNSEYLKMNEHPGGFIMIFLTQLHCTLDTTQNQQAQRKPTPLLPKVLDLIIMQWLDWHLCFWPICGVLLLSLMILQSRASYSPVTKSISATLCELRNNCSAGYSLSGIRRLVPKIYRALFISNWHFQIEFHLHGTRHVQAQLNLRLSFPNECPLFYSLIHRHYCYYSPKITNYSHPSNLYSQELITLKSVHTTECDRDKNDY